MLVFDFRVSIEIVKRVINFNIIIKVGLCALISHSRSIHLHYTFRVRTITRFILILAQFVDKVQFIA